MKIQYNSSRTKNNKITKTSSVYFECINERAAHVKIDPLVSYWAIVNLPISLVIGWLSTMNENQKALGG